MSVFIEGKKLKSTTLASAFMLSLVYGGVYAASFVITAPLVERLVPETAPGVLAVWGPPVVISLIASGVCAAPVFFASKTDFITGAFMLLGFYAAGIVLFLFMRLAPEARQAALQPVLFYLCIPVILGNLVCRAAVIWKGRITSDSYR